MSVATRLGAFAIALALAFGAAFAVGGAVDPIGQDPAPPEERPADQDHGGHP